MYFANQEGFSGRVEAKEAKRGCTYYCPKCNKLVKLRKGTTMQPHYAHYNHEGIECSKQR